MEKSKEKEPSIPISRAAYEGNIELVRKHLGKGSDVNAKYAFGRTLLHFACSHINTPKHKEIIELLIDTGADVNSHSDYGTPLHEVAAQNQTQIAELLIAAGADVNSHSDYVDAPIHQATLSGGKKITELLISAGADLNAKSIEGKTPLNYAIQYNKTGIADLLRKHGGKTSEELLKAEGK